MRPPFPSPPRAVGTAALAMALAVALGVEPLLVAASRAPVRARHAMVGSTDARASEVGLAVLRDGGNAVDAAVAMGFALAVTHPAAGNLGGGGFMVIRFPDSRETTIDYRETAPGRAHADMFLDEHGEPLADRSRVGPLAAGVPGSVAGLSYARERYGTRPLEALMAPAIALARDGFEIGWALSDSLRAAQPLLSRFPASAAAYLGPDGRAPDPGATLVQPDLARTLARIAAHGAEAFYRGAIAEQIADEMRRTGGLITEADLAAYRPVERPPVTGTYRGMRIVSMGPPSSGGIALIQLLNLLEAFPLEELGHNSSASLHLVAEAARRVYADRSEWLGDPEAYPVPLTGLLSKRYADHLREGIDTWHATPSTEVRPGQPRQFESTQTTHYSVVDREGTAVSVTTTLNGSYGSGQVVTGAGFLLNNEMDDFSVKPGAPNLYGLVGGEANAVAPGKRMLSSMTPTIVVRDGRAWLVLGSPGGSRIITTVLQVLLNVIDHGMDVQEAVDAPRVHHQWQPDEIRLERRGFPLDVIRALETRGHRVRVGSDSGDVHAIQIDPHTGLRMGASDPREDGLTLGF